MSENEGGESRSIGAFLLGFLTGVLVCVGAGGAFFVVQWRTGAEQARQAEMEARAAMEEAMIQRDLAEREAQRARQAHEAARKSKGKQEKENR
jgi:hypothetical protein